MTGTDKIVAIGLLTEKNMRAYGRDLKDVYVVPSDGQFDDLLRQVREAVRKRG